MKVFVARPFDEVGQKIFDDLIALSLAALGLEPVHGPRCNTKGASDRIFATMTMCEAVLAVVAGANKNVYIEIGIAIALLKPLILLATSRLDCGMLQDDYPVVLLSNPGPIQQLLSELSRSH